MLINNGLLGFGNYAALWSNLTYTDNVNYAHGIYIFMEAGKE